jgi:class 3 adenylate cyclase/tetratricopeptide (TPR) repeat protein
VAVCDQCGLDNPASARFCNSCGAPLAAEAPAGVRKTVTIVFCDLVGSTALGERSDPEVLREVMGRYHAELRTILERHGGTVEKFVGDAAMAVFGIPQLHEDDALRAVRAAFEMRKAVEPLGLEVRIGVNTGEVVAGAGETLVTGDAVNVAARLEQSARSGDVLIGEATERLVRGLVRVDAVTPLELKGKSKPVPAFRVLELLGDVPAFTRPISAPFVGRGDELEQLESALASAFEGCSPQLATIVGPPGIGKSRLARELLERAQARVIVGRCLSYGEGITYWPLSEIASQVGDVRAALGSESDAELAASRIGAALGSAGVSASAEEIAWGFRRLFEALARTGPLIVVFDDIHWAEPTLLDLIEYVVTFAQDVPLFLLCTARADLFEVRAAWAAPKPNATLLTLEPLAGSDTESLVDGLGGVADATKARIVRAAEGNPLFVEQLVAMQAENGNGELEIPPTIQALLAARIDRLEPEERSVIERGSIEGRLFHRGTVAQLASEQSRLRIGSHLMTLVRKELIRPDRPTLPGDDGFRFGHILIRDAAYASVPKKLRGELHEGCATWLASRLGDGAPAEIIGYHLEQAYRYGAELAAPDGALGTRAAIQLAAAGRAARSRQDVAATVNLFGRAAELVPERDASRAGVLVEFGSALHQTGELTRAKAVLEEATSLAAEAGDAHVEWLARMELGLLRLRLEPEGATARALQEAEAAIAAPETANDHPVLARAWYLIGEAHLMRAQGKEQSAALEHALAHARQSNDVILEIEVVTRSAPPIVFGPVSVQEGMRHVEVILEQMGEIPAVQNIALHILGHLRARLGQFDGALDALTRWRGQFRELGQEMQYAITAGCVWDVCSLAEDWAGGEQALREGYAILERMEEKGFLSTSAAYLGEAVLRQGRFDEAERYSAISQELGASDDLLNEAVWRALRAKVLAARGDFEQAESLARAAVEIAASTDYLDLRAATWLDLAEILRAARSPELEAAASEALALYELKGNTVGAARASGIITAGLGRSSG